MRNTEGNRTWRYPISPAIDTTIAQPLFSVITVTLDAGTDLDATAKSILEQNKVNFEYIVKDAGSRDGSVQRLPKDPRLQVVVLHDQGIFDAMNQALARCRGRYVVFMNAGDGFAAPNVLSGVAAAAQASGWPALLYTDYHNRRLGCDVFLPPQLTRRYLFRRIPCHQAVYVRRDTFERTGPFDGKVFPILADNQSILELLLAQRGTSVHVPVIGNYYQDGGYYTRPGNFAKRERERAVLRRRYFSLWERLRWGVIFGATFPVLRSWLIMRYPKHPLLPTYQRLASLVNRLPLFWR